LQFSAGCPYQCEFCDVPNLFGRQARMKSPQQPAVESADPRVRLNSQPEGLSGITGKRDRIFVAPPPFNEMRQHLAPALPLAMKLSSTK
jgi:hypothetical protein